MSQTVNTHTLMEIIARKLFGIESVPVAEKNRMVNRAAKAAVEWHNAMVTEEIEAFAKRVNARAEKTIAKGMVSGAHYNAIQLELQEMKAADD